MAAGFKFVDPAISARAIELPVTSATYAVGDLIETIGGTATWAACTSTTDHFTRKAVVTKGGTTVTTVYAVVLTGNELIEVESANNSAAADRGDRMTLTDSNTVNNTGTDVTGQAVSFQQFGELGAAADKRLLGYVIVGNGVDPDAA